MTRVRAFVGVVLVSLCFSLHATTFTVTSASSSGPGTLNEAITLANANPGPDVIAFSIGSGSVTILLTNPLPVITGATTIDGSTQPGYTASPLIAIDANGFVDCLQFANSASEGTSQVIALSLKGAVLAGIRSATPLRVANSLIGEPGAKSNGNGLYLEAGSSATTFDRNVIGGNQIGINAQPGIDGLTITGNMIGVEADGATVRPNTTAGISLIGVKNAAIGGTTAAARNVISGNDNGSATGTGVEASQVDHLTVSGNYIGITASGTAGVLTAQRFGIVVSDATNSVIGGTDAAARNVVSGDSLTGIAVGGNSDRVEVLNNFVGLNAAGTALILSGGVGITAGGSNIVVGRSGAGNVIAGRPANAITASMRGQGLIQGNLIGLDAAGVNVIGNGGIGIDTRLSSDLLVDANTIVGCGSDGIALSGFAPSFVSSGIVVQRNRIGITPSGASAPNHGRGIHISTDAIGNTIGMTTSPSQGNVIMFNGLEGVSVEGNASGNAIRANSIDQNGALGVNLGTDSVTANDPLDADGGPNTLQNFPVIAAAATGGGATNISGSLDSTPHAAFIIDFFSSPAADPSGYGEGRTFLGSAAVSTDGAGHAAFSQLLPPTSSGSFVTATATGAGGTSEFSRAVVVTLAAEIPVFWPGALIGLALALALLGLKVIAKES